VKCYSVRIDYDCIMVIYGAIRFSCDDFTVSYYYIRMRYVALV